MGDVIHCVTSTGSTAVVTLVYVVSNASGVVDVTDGTTATYSTASYRVDRNSTPGAVKTLYGQTWPPHLMDDNAVSVTWWAGYGAAGSSVPAAIRHAILMIVGILYEKRAAAESGSLNEVPFGVKSLLDSQRWGSYR